MLEFGTHVSAAGGVDLALGRAAEFSMTSCQLFTKNERQWNAKPLDPAVVERFLSGTTTSDLKHLVSHDSYLINMATPNDELWEKSREALKEELRRCDQLAIPYLVSHPGAHVGTGIDAGIVRIGEAIRRVHDETPESQAILLLETTAGQGTTIGSTFEEIAAIIAEVEDKSRVGVCMDTCHIFAAGYDIRNAETYAATMAAFDSIVGLNYLKCIHINDSQKGFGSKVDRHAHIGEGEIGLSGFEHLVNDPRLAGLPGVLETPKGTDAKEDGINLAALRGLIKVSS
jgi:deoxyribonuclease-4